MSITSYSRLISQIAKQDPDRLAISCGDQTITREQLDKSTNRLARAYQQIGVTAGDFVTIGLPNSIEFIQACVALWKIGATPQPVSSRLPTRELLGIIELAGPSLVIGLDKIPKRKNCAFIPVNFKPDKLLSEALLPDVTSRYWKAPTSGGSTGRPKLIVSEVPSEADLTLDSVLRLENNRSVLIPGPLYHNGPFMAAIEALLRGNHVVITRKFDALETVQLIQYHQIDWVLLVPTMMQRIWRQEKGQRNGFNLSSLRIVLHVAAPCPKWLKQAWIDWLGADVIHELYGGTEAQGATWITGQEWLNHQGSVGKAIDGCQIRIFNDQGRQCSTGEMGSIYFLPDTGQGSTYHYLGAEPTSTHDGWETLGDIGYFDEEGYLYLCDRKQDLIISGGANIFPAEVEAAIDAHPAVRSCAVVGIPHEDLGQAVHAVIETDAVLSQEEIVEFLADYLVRYKIPRSVEFVKHAVRDDAGKVRRSALVTA